MSTLNHHDVVLGIHAKLVAALRDISSDDALHECKIPLSLYDSNPGSIVQLADSNLRVFPFDAVEICWRRAYEEACLWSVAKVLEGALKACDYDARSPPVTFQAEWTDGIELKEGDWLDEVVRLCDTALIMTGAPGRKDTIHWVLNKLESVTVASRQTHECSGYESQEQERPRKRIKLTLPPPKHDDSGVNHDEDKIHDKPKVESQASATAKQEAKRMANTKPMPGSPRARITPSCAKLSNQSNVEITTTKLRDSAVTTFPKTSTSTSIPLIDHPIPRLSSPSLEAFHAHIHKSRTPVILTDIIDHWPAVDAKKWRNPTYWMQKTLGGRRRVPIELGKSYVDDGWGQKIVRFGDFMRAMLGEDVDLESDVSAGGEHDEVDYGLADVDEQLLSGTPSVDEHGTIWHTLAGQATEVTQRSQVQVYLAQHDLLTQIPALRNDIAIPDYCYLAPPPDARTIAPARSEDKDDDTPAPLLNMWLGPASTISPCHTDPHHNVLAQVFGCKYVRLYAPEEEMVHGRMYPMGKDLSKEDSNRGADAPKEEQDEKKKEIDMSNTSRVDISAFLQFPPPYEHLSSTSEAGQVTKDEQDTLKRQQLEQFPRFAEARYVDAILGPGECLYIPKGWWHYVRSLECSCSVSFWWD
jgi:hypothetical protein